MKTTKAAGHDKELHIPLTERIKSIPEIFGIRLNEEPEYEVLKKDGQFEIRKYQSQVLAEVTLNGMEFDQFRETGFKKLASYIFGENVGQEKMGEATGNETTYHSDESHADVVPMTSPMLEEEGFNKEWTMSFILPKKYTLKTAPRPLHDEIKLREVPAYEAAVVRYSGTNTSQQIKAHEVELIKWIKSQPDLELDGRAKSAQYDAPFVIPFLRRNEVMIKIDHLQ